MRSPSTQDRLEIYELYARYSWALDTGDTDGYVALFSEDAEATEETRSGELEVRKGRAEICKLVLKFHDRADFPGHQHQMAQFVFDPDPEHRPDHWVVRSQARCFESAYTLPRKADTEFRARGEDLCGTSDLPLGEDGGR